MQNLLRKPPTIAILFTISGFMLLVGLHHSIILLSLAGTVFALGGIALLYGNYDRDSVTLLLVMSLLIFAGFYHRPVTEGVAAKAVYWVQSALTGLAIGAVFLKRRNKLNRLFLWVILPMACLYIISGVYALANGALLQYVNGFRKILFAPLLLFLGYNLAIEKPGRAVHTFFLTALGLQLPLSLIANYLFTGFWFEFPEPDYLSGSFGLGGSSSIAVMAAIVPALSIWMLKVNQGTRKRLALSMIFTLALIAITDIKFTWFFLPMMLVISVLLPTGERSNPRKNLPVFIIIGITVLFVIIASTLSVRRYSKLLQTSREENRPLSVLSLEFLRIYYRIDDRGIRFSPGMEQPVANRLGSILIALEYSTKSTKGALLGYGLDSTTRKSLLGTSFIEEAVGASGIGNQTLSRLLLETGWPGLALFSLSVLVVLVRAFQSIRDPGKDGEIRALAGMILVYGLGMLLSFPYGLYGLDLSAAGPFWLLSGLWIRMEDTLDE